MRKNWLVLVRHGESIWNQKNLFTGWVDVELSKKGFQEARQAGLALKKENIPINHAFSSALKRSIQTLEAIIQAMELQIPFIKNWSLNERHYGALQGQNKEKAVQEFGAKTIHEWRRGFFKAPPPLTAKQTLQPPELYKDLAAAPKTESLKDTQDRVLPFWNQNIMPLIKQQKSVLISAHGNSLRTLIKKLEKISDKDISSIEIQTGQPIIYQLNRSAEILHKDIL